MTLPDGISLFRRGGLSKIEAADDLSMWAKDGFEPCLDSRGGGKVTIYLFASELEMEAFAKGMEAGIPGDDVSWVLQADGESELYAMIVHDAGDSTDELEAIDYRQGGGGDVGSIVTRLMRALETCSLRLSVNAPANNLDALDEARAAIEEAKQAGFEEE